MDVKYFNYYVKFFLNFVKINFFQFQNDGLFFVDLVDLIISLMKLPLVLALIKELDMCERLEFVVLFFLEISFSFQKQ